MPAASLCGSSTFTVAFTQTATYSTTLDNPLNIFRISQAWDPATVAWNSPWAAGGAYTSVGTASQSVVYPAEGTVYTFSPGAGYNFPYGVFMKGDIETSISYRKAWRESGPYPTLAVNYTPPAGTANGNIRSWAYLGHYAQGATADHVTRINTDSVTGTYGGVPVDETQLAPNAADGSAGYAFGNSYGTYKWKTGTGSADVVNLLESGFYNAAAQDNGTTYAAVYMKYTGTTTSAAYIGWGSDDDCKIWVNEVNRANFLGDGRGAAADTEFDGPLTLTQNNWYRVVMKVENGGGGYGLHLRFAKPDRTALSGCTFYTTDSTAPSTPTDLAAAGVTSGAWQKTVSAPTFTWTSGTDSEVSGQGVSGVRGQKYYFGTSSSGSPGTFTTDTSYGPGAQASGTYYFNVNTIDYALNESSTSTFEFKYDNTPPTGISMGFGTITSSSIEVTGGGTDAHSGINASTGYNYSRTGASDSGPKGASHTWTDLQPNTQYGGLVVTVSDQLGNTADPSTAQSKWTLSAPPGAGSVTASSATPAQDGPVTWTAVGGFGAGTIEYYRYVFDTSPTHTWTDTETQWSGGTIQTPPSSGGGTWYLHLKGYNAENIGNGTYDYPVLVPTHICPGIDSGTTITVSGHTGTIQWEVSEDNVNFTDISGKTGTTLDTSGLNLHEKTKYFRARVASGACSAAYSTPVMIAVDEDPLNWTGGNGDWDFSTAGLWKDGGAKSTRYCDSFNALLDDSVTNDPAIITLETTVSPLSVSNNSTASYTISGTGKISGSGGLTKLSSSTLTLNTANDYSGSTTVSGGRLLVNGAIGSGAVTVGDTATLGGGGTIGGDIIVEEGGTLAPGELDTATDTLTISGSKSVTLNAGSTTVVQIDRNDGSELSDLISGIGNFTAGGSLQVANLGADFEAGDEFQLFNAGSYAGEFITISPANPNGSLDLAWDTVALKTSGLLRVHSSPTANSPTIRRGWDTSLKIKLSDLFNTSDGDGDPVVLKECKASPKGATITHSDKYIFYTLAANVNDEFDYVVTDNRGGTRTAKINIDVVYRYGQAQGITVSGGAATARFAGVPGFTYIVQRATDVDFTQNLKDLWTTNAPGDGLFIYVDNDPPSEKAFYRLKYPGIP